MELTEKQKAIKNATFRQDGKILRFDFTEPYFTNDGRKAYYLQGSNKQSAYTEDVLMTAIYKGRYKQGFVNITAKINP